MDYKFILSRFTSRDNIIVLFFVVVSILSSHFVFSEDLVRVFLSFITLIPLFAVFKSNIQPIQYSLALLFFSAVELTLGNEKIANQLGIYSFWLLVVAGAVFSIECLKNRLTIVRDNASHR